MKNLFSQKVLVLIALISNSLLFGNIDSFGKEPTNVILIIGDGMGVAQWQAGLIANKGQLNLKKFENIGFLLNHSANSLSGAAPDNSTAFATGVKSYMGAVSVNSDTIPVKSIIEYAEGNGISTGIVSANTLLEGGVAPFVAHEKTRKEMENIAASYLTHNLDVFIGAGSSFFTQRKDGRNLLEEFRQKGYQVVQSMDSIKKIKSGKLAGLTADQNNLGINEGRGSMFPDAVQSALNILSKNKKQFFLLIADVFIDRASHSGNAELVALETIDLDRAIGKALEFAEKGRNTVVIVTGGPEASGMALTGGSFPKGIIEAKWAAPGMVHTGNMTPVFAFGPGSVQFRGIQDNTEIFHKMTNLLELKINK